MTTMEKIIREGNDPLVLDENEMQFFSETIFKLTGIHLTPAKSDLLKTRLRKRLQDRGFSSYREYKVLLENIPQSDPEWQSFINILTTNKTDFFREPKHFEYLIEKFIPEWLKSNEETLRVWSAASSTGEEAYTLAMVLSKYLPKDRSFTILGTDVDTNVLKKAQNAVYSMMKFNEIPPEYQSMIDIGKDEAEGWFRIKNEIKNRVSFRQHNLIEGNYPAENPFDVVLCRNVLIYFARETVAKVNRKLYAATKADGVCMIGHSESFHNITHQWKSHEASIYRK
ncbi:protein-glutamate O-methyltransferase CheR [Bacteriovorax sp. PP10]|uniref:protein-glutamate O-methyltransferase n=1 Tax=Bacteriovorax antarcticus TaxID=3088717 RepID=A0ABU5VXP2_9BACT|nr:protein-glutamate O-methyltransferase CheR [Bacteriovorax sp. PP10]MEA9357377.1 protein-glutamate O-methyltransferase CheR [Bacteriovorax sp. PP10]